MAEESKAEESKVEPDIESNVANPDKPSEKEAAQFAAAGLAAKQAGGIESRA
jgi:hypothetical protein